MSSLTVPCLADNTYKQRMKVYAAERGVSMAAMTRLALETVYGENFDNEVDVASFFAKSGAYENHSNAKGTTKKEKKESS